MNMKNVRRAAGWILVPLAAAILPVSNAVAGQPVDVKDVWLKRNCLDKGTADFPLGGDDFEACLRKQIENLPSLDKSKREHFGEQYNPSKYVECRLRPGSRNNSACNVYILRRHEWPEYWPENAKRIKWPEPPTESVYRHGMTAKEYWEALCHAEAGEFVFQTVSSIKSIYNVRPRGVASDAELSDRYVLEDPFTYTDVQRSHKPEEYFVQPYIGSYLAYEIRRPESVTFLRYFRSDKPTGPPYQTGFQGRWVRVPYLVAKTNVESVSSRYAITWRGISRPRDREHGIAGGEILIFDVTTGEILGVRRGFALSGSVPNKASGFWWMSAARCPTDRGFAPNMAFIQQVLRPVPDVNSAIKPMVQ